MLSCTGQIGNLRYIFSETCDLLHLGKNEGGTSSLVSVLVTRIVMGINEMSSDGFLAFTQWVLIFTCKWYMLNLK
jgi:hypothetical protein